MLRFFTVILWLAASAGAQTGTPKKVFVITDLEGVDGIFNFDLQCIPYESARYHESQKLLTGEVNAAVDGLLAGGAAEVMLLDGHAGGRNLSTLDIHPKARLLVGTPIAPTLELDSSYAALVFIGLHAMAGAKNAVLPHSYTWEIHNIRVNGKPTGEIGGRTLLAGALGVPAIMLSGDRAACEEFHDLVPEGECAEVKSGVSGAAGYSLPHDAACALIRKKSQRAMERLASDKPYRPYRLSGPVEVKVEFTTEAQRTFRPRAGVEQMNARTWVFRGKDILDAWLKYSSF